jgi:hypothetical protein
MTYVRDAAWCEAEIAAGRRIIDEIIHLDRPLSVPDGVVGWIERCTISYADGGDLSWLHKGPKLEPKPKRKDLLRRIEALESDVQYLLRRLEEAS